jgi:sterol desaturase/sphingolipid hydroxylase (fatty acid hydroxylase superfamily)
MVSLCAQFHHANFDFPDPVEKVLSKILVTPRYHASHHAVDRRYGDANFATIFSCWDPIFRSYSAPGAGGSTTNAADALGLPEGREDSYSPIALLAEPIKSRNLALAKSASARHTGP